MSVPTENPLPITLTVNNEPVSLELEPRALLSDTIRHTLGLTGTHVGCEEGVCGACTVLVDGVAVRSCLMFAVQADGCDVQTVESLATDDGSGKLTLNALQQAFHEEHGLQCGFCTAGILMTLTPWLADNPSPTEHEIRTALSGNLCRCTGYQNIVRAVQRATETDNG